MAQIDQVHSPPGGARQRDLEATQPVQPGTENADVEVAAGVLARTSHRPEEHRQPHRRFGAQCLHESPTCVIHARIIVRGVVTVPDRTPYRPSPSHSL